MEKTKFIAEVSSNHLNNLSRCYKIIDACKKSGFYAVKFQLFKIDKLFSPEILKKSLVHKKRKKWEGYDPTTDKPRPRPNPLGIKEKKHHFKKGGTMEPYRGSYISGTVDGTKLSNPSLRKYYKGLI